LKAAHEYYNNLVRAEMKRRHDFRLARAEQAPELASLETQVEALNAQIEAALEELRAKRSNARSRVADKAVSDRVKALKSRRKPLHEQLVAERKRMAEILISPREEFKRRVQSRAATEGSGARIIEKINNDVARQMLAETCWPEFWRRTFQIERDFVSDRKCLRAACGLVPGTYSLVEDAVAKACDDSAVAARGALAFCCSNESPMQTSQLAIARNYRSRLCQLRNGISAAGGATRTRPCASALGVARIGR
jgi:hypothetical protein